MAEKQTPMPEAVVEIPQDITEQGFLERLKQARRQPPGQVLFSSTRGDRFFDKRGNPADLVNAHLLMGFSILNERMDVRRADPESAGRGSSTVSEPDIEGVQTMVDHWDLGGGFGVRVERDTFVPHLADESQQQRIDRLIIATEPTEAQTTAA